MKTIGLIGGMSWESSDLYYQVINRKVQQILDGIHSCQCLMFSVDFAEIASLQHMGEWDLLAKKMISAAQRLERGGADFMLLCTNTMHKVAGEIQQNVNIPLLHIVDATANAIQNKKLKKLGLLATRFSMEDDFLKGRFQSKYGIETIVPEENERRDVHEIIYSELIRGIISESSKQRYLEIIENLILKGAEGIIAGCTEIELVIKPSDLQVELFETTKIHAEMAVRIALE
ncbi:aspartate/glutamate racemase family protein [Pedobacter miscanthi]|uniref:aspartate/glutamate racemase family protein n=1 Tax=Pedobacter miscanthi TaxID=2259170 RepID=UPI00292E96AF|nr:aspartate/glutamate racemase family protein [Pedobacter miscanthi]